MGTVFTSEWKANMNELAQKNKEDFGQQTKAPYDDGTAKRGDLYFKPGKGAYMSSHLIALHKYFFKLLQKKFSIKSNKIVDEERIIELIITKNHNFLLWNGKKMR